MSGDTGTPLLLTAHTVSRRFETKLETCKLQQNYL